MDRDRVLVESWLAGLRSDNTRSAYGTDLARFAAWWADRRDGSLLGARRQDIERYRQEAADSGAADSTLARWTSALRSFFGHAVAAGKLDASPVSGWITTARGSSAVALLTAADVDALVAASVRLGPRDAALVGLLVLDGVRLAEALAADAGDVTFQGSAADLDVSRRSGIDVLRLDPLTARSLRDYLGERTIGPLLLGESPTREPARLTRFGADYVIKHAGSMAGIEAVISANVLRRAYVACQRADGVALEDISARLGHRDVRTTRRHIAPDP